MGEKDKIFSALGLRETLSGASYGGQWFASSGDWIESRNPATGELLAKVEQASEADYNTVVAQAMNAFEFWRAMPAPKRGEIVRQLGLLYARKRMRWGGSSRWKWAKSSPKASGKCRK